MFIWLFYDIRKNRIRSRVARYCKQAGLRRVQKSVFVGKINKSPLKRLQQDIANLIHPKTDVVHIQPINRLDLRKLIKMGEFALVPTLSKQGTAVFY